MLKQIIFLLTGLALCVTLAACSATGIGSPDKENPPAKITAPLTLNSLNVVFKGENTPLLLFEKEKKNYIVQTTDSKTALELVYDAPGFVNVEFLPTSIPKFTSSLAADGMVTVDLENLPVPRKDPDFETAPAAGVDGYSVVLTLSLKDGAPESTDEGGTICFWQPNTYIVMIQEPASDISSDSNQAKIAEKIAEAEQKIQNLGLVVGNPNDNDTALTHILTLVEELNTLKHGNTETTEYETRVQPEAGAVYTTQQNASGETVYIVTETRQVYDHLGILTKAKQLNTALENSSAGYLIVKKLEISYKAPAAPNDPNVQDITIGSTGKYTIEMAGGSGGHVWTGTNDTATGGRAAKVSAVWTFTQGQKLGFRIGGEGIGTADLAIINDPANNTPVKKRTALKEKWGGINTVTMWRETKPGGWNGGGSGGAATGNKAPPDDNAWNWSPGSSGGGATDLQIYDVDGLNFIGAIDFNPATDARIMVAAGGGGSAQAPGTGWKPVGGGHAGQNGIAVTNGGAHVGTKLTAQHADTGGTYTPYDADPSPPGGPTYVKAASAAGDNGKEFFDRYEGRGGGGGGFQGGEAVSGTKDQSYKTGDKQTSGSGAGGSSHVKAGAHSKSISLRNDQFGSGYAVIEWLE